MAATGANAARSDAPIGEFTLGRLERVIYGPGKIATLRGEIERHHRRRALVVTTHGVAQLPILGDVTRALGTCCVGVFSNVAQHVPRSTVDALSGEIERVSADCLVSFGGGSPIDCCKLALHGFPASSEILHIAVPTTLSAAEYTHVGGATNESTRVKATIYDENMMPRTVIADPSLAFSTPDWLWVTTGVRALDHAIECSYTIRHQPISDALASKAIAILVEHLPASIRTEGEERIAHRGHCQIASWFSIYGAMNTGFGLSHLLGHQIGPRWDIPHGVTSCITLPHVMRFMAGFAAHRFGPIAEGYGIPFDRANPRLAALACADRTDQLISQFDVPRGLRAFDVPKNDLAEIVAPIADELGRVGGADRTITDPEVLALLEACY